MNLPSISRAISSSERRTRCPDFASYLSSEADDCPLGFMQLDIGWQLLYTNVWAWDEAACLLADG